MKVGDVVAALIARIEVRLIALGAYGDEHVSLLIWVSTQKWRFGRLQRESYPT